MTATVAVIIPYFQRTPGILARAIRSILQQQGCQRPHIIIVDDESPVPAESEISAFDDDVKSAMTVISQANRGPSGARNVGLDAVPPDTEWIALLDSDDIWIPNHLGTALSTLDRGYDLFFADHKREGLAKTHFNLAGFAPLKSHPIDPMAGVYEFPDDLFTVVLKHSPIGMSTLVMRRSQLGAVRFASNLRLCEDLLYSLHLARASGRVAVGHNVHVTYGKGMNMSVVSWDSSEAITCSLNYARYYDEVRRCFPLTAQQQDILRLKEKSNRETLCRSALNQFLRGKWSALPGFTQFMLQNPRTCIDALQVVRSELVRRTTGRFV